MQQRGRFVLGSVLLLLSTACSGSDDEVAISTVTTVAEDPVDPVDPFTGTWRAIDDDGMEVELVISQGSGTTYGVVMTDGHAVACAEFGAPVTGVFGGTGEGTGEEFVLTYDSLVCRTSWGDITKELGTAEVLRLEDGVLLSAVSTCFRQAPAQSCEGMDRPAQIEALPDVDLLVEQYGLEWVQDNYQGELTEIGLDPAQLHPCLIPEKTPDLSTWEITFTDLGGLPRAISCGPGGIWVHQRNAGSAAFLNTDGVAEFSYRGVGEPKGNEALVVFHTFTTIDFTTDPGAEFGITSRRCR